MSDALTIAGSALTAFSTRQAATAANIANMDTPDYQARVTVMQSQTGGGVTAAVGAGGDRVELSREVTTLIGSANGFKANAAVARTAREMDRDLFSITA